MHMPGHKRRMKSPADPYSIDITEIDGFDNLHHAQGILKEAQERAAALYHSQETFYLVNGSTAGILSAVSGCTSFGGRILIARNCHRCVYHAALLKGLRVDYVYPRPAGDMGINGVIFPEDVDKILNMHPDIEAVLVTSPTYDGVVSDIGRIVSVVHSHGLPLIVDEAHGAHFPFSGYFPEDSVSCGADVVIHSLHKTLPSPTQTALIHLNGDLIDRPRIREYLGIYQSSSPSYVLMAGIDDCIEWVSRHPRAFDDFFHVLQKSRGTLEGMEKLKLLEFPGADPSKILVRARGAGMNGYELSQTLRKQYHIEAEMACASYICAIAAVMDTEKELNRFCRALLETDRQLSGSADSTDIPECIDQVLPTESVCTIREASERKKTACLLADAAGEISGVFVSLYPPGIPLLVPGEAITREIADKITWYVENGFEIQGMEDGTIEVLKENIHG